MLASAPDGWSPVGDTRRPRVRPEELFRLSQTLTDRDWEIVKTVAKLRLVTSPQIERLHFFDMDNEASRKRVRRRVMKRLNDSRVVIALPRRIGGTRHGSEAQVYALDKAGAELIQDSTEWKNPHKRTLAVPGALFFRHRLAVSELYVRLKEFERTSSRTLLVMKFDSEPACWWRYDKDTEYGSRKKNRGHLKPDAFLSAGLSRSDYFHQFWIEIDLGTETLSRITDKVKRYASYFRDSDHSEPPNGFRPKILITTHTIKRRDSIKRALDKALWQESSYGEKVPLAGVIDVRVEFYDDTVRAIVEALPTRTVAEVEEAERAKQREIEEKRAREAEAKEAAERKRAAEIEKMAEEYRRRQAAGEIPSRLPGLRSNFPPSSTPWPQ